MNEVDASLYNSRGLYYRICLVIIGIHELGIPTNQTEKWNSTQTTTQTRPLPVTYSDVLALLMWLWLKIWIPMGPRPKFFALKQSHVFHVWNIYLRLFCGRQLTLESAWLVCWYLMVYSPKLPLFTVEKHRLCG